MNVYFANGTNMVVGCDNEKGSYYFCQKDGNDCCKKDTCKRYLNSEGQATSRLFKTMCTSENNNILYIPEGDENSNE